MKKIVIAIMIIMPILVRAEVFEVNNIWYATIDSNNKVEVTKSIFSEYSGKIDIPTTVEYNNIIYSVVRIGDKAFWNCSSLTSVTIGNGVTTIGENAFYGCRGLKSITIPNSVTSIGNSAFFGCTGLISITIPNSVTSIGSSAFEGCTGLTSITIPNSVTTIREYTFYGCTGLISITIPKSVTSIGYDAFNGCSRLTTVTIPISVTSIGSYAFAGCNAIKNVIVSISDYTAFCNNITLNLIRQNIGKPVQLIDDNNAEISEFVIPKGVTSVGNYAFYACSGLNSVIIPNSVTSIGNSSFEGCSNLKSLTIGSGVLSFGNSAVNNAKPKKVIWLTNTPPSGYENIMGEINYVANDSYTKLSNTTVYPFISSLFEVDGMKYVPVSPSERTCDAIDCAYNNTAEKIHIGEKVSYKGVEMTVKEVKPYTCYANEYIKNVELGLAGTIGDCAFKDCNPEQTSIEIPGGVTSIGNDAFAGWQNLASVSIYCPVVGSWFKGFTSIKEVKLGEEVSVIEDNAFEGCTCLASLNIPQSVTSIGNRAFQGCSGLTSLIIPQSITSIGNDAFAGWQNLTSVSIYCPAVGSWFKGFTSLKEVTLGEEVLVVENNAFEGCTGLTSLNIPQSVTSIGNSAFQGCSGLTDVIMNNKLTCDFTNDIETYTKRTYTWVWDNSDEKWYVLNNLNKYEPYGIYADNMNTWYEGKLAYVDEHEWEYTNGEWNDLGTKIKTKKAIYIGKLSNASGYIDLGLPFNDNIKIQMKFYPIQSNGGAILGEKEGKWRFFFSGSLLYYDFDSSRKYVSKQINKMYEWEIGNYYIKDIDANSHNIINGTAHVITSNRTSNMLLNGGSGDLNRFYYVKVFDGETLVRDFIPYYDGANFGLWDTITNKAYMPTGEGWRGELEDTLDYPKYYCKKEKPYYTIGDYAFSNCNNLQGISMPDDVISIGNNAFQNCSAMSTVKISNSVKNIGSSAFNGCSAIHEIFIPKSVKTINDNVFKGCTSLNTVIMEDKESELTLGSNGSSPLFADCPLDSVYIGRNITYPTPKEKGYSPFYRNASLRSVMITDKETEISENEFYGCSNLKNVSIGDGVTTIGNWAFSGCSSLDYFSFGTNMKTIGKEAFSDCTAMTNLYSSALIPPVCDLQALDDINKWNCKLHIPNGTISAYQQADQWKDFFFIYDDVSGIRTTVTDTSESIIVYDLNGHKKEGLQRGINIIKYSDGTVKKVIQK